MSTLRPKFLRVGPDPVAGFPTIVIELESGDCIVIPIDRGHGRAIAERIVECVDGRVLMRPPSRRNLELELVVVEERALAKTEPAPAAERVG